MNGLTTQQGYDYTTLPLDIAPDVEQAATYIRQHRDNISVSIIAIGNQLRHTKAQLPHGEWGKWLEQEFQWSDRQARRFMQVSERFGGKTDNLSVFGTSALYLLASDSVDEEIIDEAIERAKNGEHISHAVAKEMVAERKQSQSAGVVWVEDETEDETVQDEQHTCFCGQKARHRIEGTWYCDDHVPTKTCPTCGRETMSEGDCHTCKTQRLVYQARHEVVAKPEDEPVQFCEYTISKRNGRFVVAKDGHEIRLQTRGHAERLITGCYTATAPGNFDKDINQDEAWDFKLKTQPQPPAGGVKKQCERCGVVVNMPNLDSKYCPSCAWVIKAQQEEAAEAAEATEVPPSAWWETCNFCKKRKVAIHKKDDNSITIYYGFHKEGAFICNHCLEQQAKQAEKDHQIAKQAAADVIAETEVDHPEIVYFKIYLFGIELAQHAKDAMHAIGKDILCRKSYTHHIPPEDELHQAVSRHFNNLYTLIADGFMFNEGE